VVRSIKKWTSKRISDWLLTQPQQLRSADCVQEKPRFWQHESYDRIVRDHEELATFRRYIAQNSKAAKLKPEDFTYQPAEWLDAFAPRDDLSIQ